MRGISFRETDFHVAESILMSRYNQQYSEIKDIPLKKVLFLLNLAMAEDQYQEAEAKKLKAKTKGRGRKI